MVKIATWNVNSIKARLPNVVDWLTGARPDVALFQELKCVEENFPRLAIEALGYHCAVVGQKSYNGVAILSTEPIEDLVTRLPGDPADEQARYVEGTTCGLRVASIYLPNGNPADSEKYPYKLGWMARLKVHARQLLESERPVLLGGDYNVIPAERDCYDPAAWAGDALFKPATRRAFREILYLGYTEAFRALHQESHAYTFWDYQRGAWQADQGVRIDHILLSPQAADRLDACAIDKEPRGKERASDHTPLICEIAT